MARRAQIGAQGPRHRLAEGHAIGGGPLAKVIHQTRRQLEGHRDRGLRRRHRRGQRLRFPQVAVSLTAREGELTRQRHTRLLPGDFIDVAEESGLIVPIGRWVLAEACRQAVAWRQAGWPDLVMAVNLSTVQFRRGGIGDEVLAALAASGLDPPGLELELTESILLEGAEDVLVMVSAWKAAGIQLAIDDFGTGYSSLAYLKHFPVDTLKIDRSFIAGMVEQEKPDA